MKLLNEFESPAGPTLAFLSLRLWLGMRALATGIEKFTGVKVGTKPLVDDMGMPDISGAVVEVKEKVYGLSHYSAIPKSLQEAFAAEPLLPEFLRVPFYASLGWVLIASGLMLLLGIATRTSLVIMAILYTALSFGLILIKQDAGISWLAIHVALVAMALALSEHNRFRIYPKF